MSRILDWETRWVELGLGRRTTRAAEWQRKRRDYKGSHGDLTRDEVPCRNDACRHRPMRYGERVLAVYNERWLLLFCSEKCRDEHRAGARERRRDDWLRGRG